MSSRFISKKYSGNIIYLKYKYLNIKTKLIRQLIKSNQEKAREASASRERKPDPMASRRKPHEEHAADNANRHWQCCERLSHLLRSYREEARHHILIRQRNRSKHKQCHKRMSKINGLDLVLNRDFRRRWSRAIDDPQPAGGRKPIPDSSRWVPETVSKS